MWGDRDDSSGGGGTDIVTLDPWMWEFTIKISVPRTVPTNPNPSPGDDTPDPCAALAQSLATLNAVLEADKTALQAFDELIAAANSPAERKALRAQKRETQKSIQETEQLIQDVKAEMAKLKC